MSPLFCVALLVVVGICGVHHFGWEGIGLIAAVWLLMPERHFDRTVPHA